MKIYLTFLVVIAAHANIAYAKPTVTVTQFENKITNGKCTLDKPLSKDLNNILARQVIGIFANHADLLVMNLEHKKKKSPQYLVTGTLRSFDQCKTQNPKQQSVKVAMEMRVIDARSGQVAYTFTSTANATGSGSTLSQTANVVL